MRTGYVSLSDFFHSQKSYRGQYCIPDTVDLESIPLDHKLHAGEGIRSILDSIATIYLSKNIFVDHFGDNLAISGDFPL